jgi:hypothetical protein
MAGTTFCPSCGAEYLSGVLECADCRVPLTPPAAVPAYGYAAATAPVDQATAGDDGDDEVVYDLAEWGQDQRSQLERLLTGGNVTHRWEVGTDLVVMEADEEGVERLMEEVEAAWDAPPLPSSADEDDGGADEANYAVMSDLFVAADRLGKDPADAAIAGEFYLAADAAAETPPPFGIDGPDWRQIQELAASVAGAMEADAEDDVISRDATALRALLARYV